MTVGRTSDDYPSIIDKVLKSNDPAIVGLRRIIKRKSEEGTSFPARECLLEEFDLPGKAKILSEDERRILELEKRVIDLEGKLKKQLDLQKKAEEAAYIKGKNEGVKTGIEKGAAETAAMYEKKIDEIQKHVGQFLAHVENEKKLIYINSEHALLQLCFEMVRKIIKTEVSVNEDVIITVVKNALTYIADRERILIHVSPHDCAKVSARKDFWAPLTEQLKNITIEEDSRIEKGGCLIESNSGMVDARLGVQLAELIDVVEKEWDSIRQSIISTRHSVIPIDR